MSQPARFRNAAKDIADSIVAAARSADDSVHWLTAAFGADRKTVNWYAGQSLYTGTSGIALFLLEASHVLGDHAYRDAALAALLWSERAAMAKEDYSFYSGRMGVVFALLRAATITGNSTHLEGALRLADGYESYAATATVNDLLGGVAGAIVGFLHLHQHTGERFCIDAVHRLAGRLVSNARWVEDGLCWDVHPEWIKGLCGMSHGVTGVAFALLEADAYLDEPAYRQLALEALRYETACYDEYRNTWPDYRKFLPQGIEYSEEKSSMTDNALTVPGIMDAWCHGAPGIALARMRAVELLGPEWLDDSMRAIGRTARTMDGMAKWNFTLCHGACGNATVFLEASRLFGESKYTAWAEDVAERAIASREENGFFASGYTALGRIEDLSLMMGNAGIGYFFLQLLGKIPNLLLPQVAGRASSGGVQASIGRVAHALAEGLMPESMSAIETSAGAECAAFFSTWRERTEVVDFVAMEASKVGAAAQSELEFIKLKMRDDCPSFALVTSLRAREKQRSAGVTEDNLERFTFQLASFSRLWHSQEEDDSPRLLRIIDAIVEEIMLTELSATLFAVFTAPTTIAAAILSLEEALDVRTDENLSALRSVVRSQVLDATHNGIIVVVGAVYAPTT
jgi:hypothetical protein